MISLIYKTLKAMWLPIAFLVLFSPVPESTGDSISLKVVFEYLGFPLHGDFGFWQKAVSLTIWIGLGEALFSWWEGKQSAFSKVCKNLEASVAPRYRRLVNMLYEHVVAGVNYTDRRQETVEAIQKSICEAFNISGVDVTYMQPCRDSDDVDRLHISVFATSTGRTPEIYRRREGFEKGVGYPGVAWDTCSVQVGNRKVLQLFRDWRFAVSPGDDGAMQAFLTIPVSRQLADGQNSELQGVLCISSEQRSMFPSNNRRVRTLVQVIEPLIELLARFVDDHDASPDPHRRSRSKES